MVSCYSFDTYCCTNRTSIFACYACFYGHWGGWHPVKPLFIFFGLCPNNLWFASFDAFATQEPFGLHIKVGRKAILNIFVIFLKIMPELQSSIIWEVRDFIVPLNWQFMAFFAFRMTMT